jgi:hypothetical protein
MKASEGKQDIHSISVSPALPVSGSLQGDLTEKNQISGGPWLVTGALVS